VKWWLSSRSRSNRQSGGQSGMLSVMDDPAYATWAPYNRAYLTIISGRRTSAYSGVLPAADRATEQVDKAVTVRSPPSRLWIRSRRSRTSCCGKTAASNKQAYEVRSRPRNGRLLFHPTGAFPLRVNTLDPQGSPVQIR